MPLQQIIFIVIFIYIILIINLNFDYYYAFAITSISSTTFEEFYDPCYKYGYYNSDYDLGEISMIDYDCLDFIDLYKINNSSIPTDITDISYLSNGESFNATLWLNSPLYDNRYSEYVEANLSFFMYIYNKREMGPYNEELRKTNTIYISPDKENNWTYRLFEVHPYEQTDERLIESNNNSNNFYQNGKKFFHMPLNLNSIGNPEKFAIQFLMTIETDYSELNFLKNKGKESLIDLSSWDTIPPGDLLITYDFPSSPTKVKIGEKKEIFVPINALGLNVQENVTLVDANQTDKIKLSFEPSSVVLPTNGTNFTKMTIDIYENFPDSNKINTQTVNTTRLVHVESTSPSNVPINESQSFSIIPLPPSSTIEKIQDFLLNYYGIYILPLGITSIFALFLTKRVNTESIVHSIRIKDLLTMNGSIIAGVLIFLTLGGTIQKEKFWQIGILTASIVYPFALSAIVTMITGSIQKGIRYTIPGFVYLMISIVLIVFVHAR